ncbi:hypothetical protein V2G26_002879 [Clonostachys chloroleuca]
MYSCSTCGRSYASQTSLTRHYHNHRKTTQHICVYCNVIFYRRDLLVRHLRSHERQLQPLPEETDLDKREATRKRCHTACLQCRALKIKCSGNVPCDNCTKLDKPCHPSNSVGRISHLADQTYPSEDLSEMMPLDDPGCEPPQPDQGLPSPQRSEQLSAGPIHDLGSLSGTSPSTQSIQNALTISGDEDMGMPGAATLHLAGLDSQTGAVTGPANVVLDSFMFDTLSWPWHHEISYLLGQEYTVDGRSTILQENESAERSNSQSGHNISEPARPSTSISKPSGNFERRSSTTAGRPNSETSNEQTQVIDEIMAFALSVRSETGAAEDQSSIWYSFSSKVAKSFHIEVSEGSEGTHLLEHFVHLYLRYFESLWPLFSPQNLSINCLHPLLYLVMTSVGAMYGDTSYCYFGSEMHSRVQTALAEPLELQDSTFDAIWLAQARCASRMAALYFGQSKAISHAHHLGTLLAAQARRMELFSAAYAEAMTEEFRNPSGSLSDQERLTIWLRLESRRRLAFGIYRSEAYTSLLLQSKPLFYLGEIDLTFPSCDAVWNGEKMPPSVCIQLIENDRTPGRDLYASEIYQIALDIEEALPAMDPLSYELLALGLLWPSWEYSRNPRMLLRLCGEEWSVPQELAAAGASETWTSYLTSQSTNLGPARGLGIRDYDHLDRSFRRMSNMHSGFRRLLVALRRWEQSLPMVKSFARSKRDRTLLLSGLIVYHLVHLRLSAPVADLHELQYRLIDGRSPDLNSVAAIARWLKSSRARFAAERAVSIWSLISGECAKPTQDRARFNLVAFAGLHDAAVLLWAYASTVSDNVLGRIADEPPLVLHNKGGEADCIINQSNTVLIIDLFGNLLDDISPGKSASFAQATKGLIGLSFPRQGQQQAYR